MHFYISSYPNYVWRIAANILRFCDNSWFVMKPEIDIILQYCSHTTTFLIRQIWRENEMCNIIYIKLQNHEKIIVCFPISDYLLLDINYLKSILSYTGKKLFMIRLW